MSWYKKALLIDKGITETDKDMFSVCQYCGRWATHPTTDKAGRHEYIWKKPEELDPQEDRDVKDALYQMKNVKYEEVSKSISHGMCNICYDIARENFHLPSEKIKEMSLGHE